MTNILNVYWTHNTNTILSEHIFNYVFFFYAQKREQTQIMKRKNTELTYKWQTDGGNSTNIIEINLISSYNETEKM